jgi:branched-chain amino acid transport system permease protein
VVLALALVARLLNARFGHVLQAIQENEVRMEAIGFPVYRFKLLAFVVAGHWRAWPGRCWQTWAAL